MLRHSNVFTFSWRIRAWFEAAENENVLQLKAWTFVAEKPTEVES